jgi:hypothetical protein
MVPDLETFKKDLLKNLKIKMDEEGLSKSLTKKEFDQLLNNEIKAEKNQEFFEQNWDTLNLTGSFDEYFEGNFVTYYYKDSDKVWDKDYGKGEKLGDLLDIARDYPESWYPCYQRYVDDEEYILNPGSGKMVKRSGILGKKLASASGEDDESDAEVEDNKKK